MTRSTDRAPIRHAESSTGSVANGRARYAWVLAPMAIAVASRIFSAVLIWQVNATSNPNHHNPFIAWDGLWYLSIARTGYHAAPHLANALNTQHDYAFFPLWPVIVRLSTGGVLDPAVTSVALANLLFVAAAILIWKLLADRFRPALATEAVGLLAFSPPAFVFSMAYSEPLFLVLAAGYFLSKQHAVRRGVFAAVASITRVAGAAIVASAVTSAISTRGAERRSALLAAGCGVAGLTAWALYVAVLVHDPLGILHGSPGFSSAPGFLQILRSVREGDPRRYGELAFVGLALAGAILILRRDRELGVYSVAAIALGLLPGGVIWSMPRYCLVAFPAFAGLADRLGRRGTILLVVGFAIAQVVFVGWSFAYPHAEAP